jgi:hypothetical protein
MVVTLARILPHTNDALTGPSGRVRLFSERLVCDADGAIAYLDRDVGGRTRTALTPIVCAQAKLVQCPPVLPAREAWQVIAHGA